MSSRRPRIKAVVASLPVRRRATDVKLKTTPKAVKSEEECSQTSQVGEETAGGGSAPDVFESSLLVRRKTADVKLKTTPKATQSELGRSHTQLGDERNAGASNAVDLEASLSVQSQAVNAKLKSTPKAAEREQECCQTSQLEEESARGSAARALDGIVPLAPLPAPDAARLKSDIISESAEVLFDPIVPLPSPTRPRAKLRPAPRLPGLVRRTSLHGSASESEEERRGVVAAHVRHNSSGTHAEPPSTRCRSTSGTESTSAPRPPVLPAAPTPPHDRPPAHKVRRRARGGGADEARRHEEARAGRVTRDRLTMYDLIFYNPTTNPIVAPDISEESSGKKEVIEKQEESAGPGSGREEEAEDADDHAPAPQIKIGPDGQIVVDEKSLVIRQTRDTRQLGAAVVETEWTQGGGGVGGRYTRAPRTKLWSDAETVRFYRALAALGTDFSLMLPLFPDRSRRDLKTKFKKEERNNGVQVDVALSARQRFDADAMAKQFSAERAEAKLRAQQERAAAISQRHRERETAQRVRRQGYASSKAVRAAAELLPRVRPRGGAGPASAHELLAARAAAELLPRDRPKRGARRISANERPAAGDTRTSPTPVRYEVAADTDPATLARGAPTGSLVCLSVADPARPGAAALQTYMVSARGLLPVSVPPAVLATLVRHMHPTAPRTPHTPHAPHTPHPPHTPHAPDAHVL